MAEITIHRARRGKSRPTGILPHARLPPQENPPAQMRPASFPHGQLVMCSQDKTAAAKSYYSAGRSALSNEAIPVLAKLTFKLETWTGNVAVYVIREGIGNLEIDASSISGCHPIAARATVLAVPVWRLARVSILLDCMTGKTWGVDDD
jgi:hypothetical protein